MKERVNISATVRKAGESIEKGNLPEADIGIVETFDNIDQNAVSAATGLFGEVNKENVKKNYYFTFRCGSKSLVANICKKRRAKN